MTETRLKGRNGGWLIFWRLLVGAGIVTLFLAGMNMSFNAGGIAGDVEENASNITKNEMGRLEMDREVDAIQRAQAAAAATTRATERRLNSIDNTLRRIESTINRATQGGSRQ